MGFFPPAVSRRIPRLFQRATQPPSLRAGDLWSHTDGSGLDYYDGSRLRSLGFFSESGPAFEVAAYHYGSATWGDAARAAYAAARAAGSGRVVFPRGQSLNLDQAGRPSVFQHLPDGVGAWTAPTVGRIVIDLNWCRLALGANTYRLVDAPRSADYQWFRNLEICNGWIDAGNVQGASINHIVFGCCVAGFLAKMNFERIAIHHLYGTNAYTNTGGTTPVRWWVGIAPQCALNDATPVVMRDISVEDCRFEGGQAGLAVMATANVAPVQPTDAFDATIQRLYADRVYHDTGWVPTAFVSGGQQLGGYALLKDSTIRRCTFKGAGDAGLETDNGHNVLVEDCVVEDAYNSEFLTNSFGAKDADQGAQNTVYSRCVARHNGGGRPTQLGGFLAYTIFGHRMGTLRLNGCRYESNSIPLNPGSGIDGLAVKQFATTLRANANAADTSINCTNASSLVVGYEVQVGGATNGEWVTVTGITDATHATVTALANNHLSGASVTQPLPIEVLDVDLEVRALGWTYGDAAGGSYYSAYLAVQQCLVRLRNLRTRVSGATSGGAGALNYYGAQVSGRGIDLDIETLDPKADITFGGAQGSYYGLVTGLLNTIRPTTLKGLVKRLHPRPGTGFPAANQTGLYLMDGAGLVIDPGILRVKDSDFSDLNGAAKPVTWQRAGENVLPVVLEESNVYANRALAPRTVRLVEHFLGGINASGSLGETGWNSGNSASGGVLSKAVTPIVSGHPGVAQLDSGTTAGGNRLWIASGGATGPTHDLAEWFIHDLVFKLAQVDANTVFRCGMAENPSLDPPLYGYWLRLLAGSAHFEFVVSNGGGSHVGASNSIAPDTNWHLLRIRRSSANGGTIVVGFSLDGAAETTFSGATAAGDTTLPTSRSVSLFAQVGNNGTANSEKAYVDLSDFLVPNLVLVP